MISLGLAFWLFMILWFVYGLVWSWPVSGSPASLRPAASHLLLLIVVIILGLAVFGLPFSMHK